MSRQTVTLTSYSSIAQRQHVGDDRHHKYKVCLGAKDGVVCLSWGLFSDWPNPFCPQRLGQGAQVRFYAWICVHAHGVPSP